MLASQAQLIPSSILGDVLSVRLAQPLNSLIDSLHAAGLPHRFCGEVGVRTSSCSQMYRVKIVTRPRSRSGQKSQLYVE